jgi:hypothetical protein
LSIVLLAVYVLLTDETNQQPSERARFFIYGGVFFPADALPDLHDLVEEIRDDTGFNRDDELKFDTRSRPEHVTRQQHTTAKRRLLEGCAELDVQFVASLVLHEIARTRTLDQLVGWGANTVLLTFQKFLDRNEERGICMADRLPFAHGHHYLEETFQQGLLMGNRRRVLDRVLLLAETTQRESFVSSVVDVILGSFRYCVNERENERAVAAMRRMLPAVVQMMWSHRVDDTIYVREYGLLFRPMNVRVPHHQEEYDNLTQHFTQLLEE